MPYIITATLDLTDEQAPDILSRRAVATLDDMLREVGHIVGNDPVPVPSTLGGNDGTVGPLPDGTVVEVRPISWGELIRASGIADRRPSYRHVTAGNMTAEERGTILAAYNGLD